VVDGLDRVLDGRRVQGTAGSDAGRGHGGSGKGYVMVCGRDSARGRQRDSARAGGRGAQLRE
jgi:hypothetical protein